MHKSISHKAWTLSLLILFTYSLNISAQSPRTKSAKFAMVQRGLPSLERLKPIEFFLDTADAIHYRDLKLSRDNFLCNDVGIQKIEISGLDSLGRPFYSTEFLWVYDSVFLCSDNISSERAIAGRIITETNDPVSNITLSLKANDIDYFKASDDKGLFIFESFEARNYQLHPNSLSIDDVRNGVSTFDVLLLQKEILGLKKLNSPYKLIAADLNNSKSLTAYDMVLLRQMILSIINEFPNDTPSWRYIPADLEFSDHQNPFLDDYSATISINDSTAFPSLDNRFIAIKMGDLNNSVNLNIYNQAQNRAKESSTIFTIEDRIIKAGTQNIIDLLPQKNLDVEGFQFSLKYKTEHLSFIGIEENERITNEHFYAHNGQINFSWTNLEQTNLADLSLKLIFKAQKDLLLSEVIQLSQTKIAAELYLIGDKILPFNIEWQAVKEANINEFKTYPNYPNPYSNSTNIPFYIPKEAEVRLKVFSLEGKLLHQQKAFFPKGNNLFRLNEQLTNTGIYLYRLESDYGSGLGKLNYLKNL